MYNNQSVIKIDNTELKKQVGESVVLNKFVPYTDKTINLSKPTLEDLLAKWDALVKPDGFSKRQIGTSVQGRKIEVYEMGDVDRPKVLLTFICHGWEYKPSLVGAEFFNDVINGDNAYLTSLKKRYHWVIVPCVNPDGFIADTRENADGIDINRDAIDVLTPEGKALKSIFDEKGEFYLYFDFHMQGGQTSHIAWLPPALRTEDYYKDAIYFTALWRRRFKQTNDLSQDPDSFNAGVLSRPEPTPGIWVEWAYQNGKVTKSCAIPELERYLTDSFFSNGQYAMFVEMCRLLLDGDEYEKVNYPSRVETYSPILDALAEDKSVAVPNRAYLVPFYLDKPTEFRYFRMNISEGGNICVGIYDKDLLLINSKQTTASPGNFITELKTVVDSGLNYLAVSSDSLTLKFRTITGGGASLVRVQRIDEGYPLPMRGVLNGVNHDVVPLIVLTD